MNLSNDYKNCLTNATHTEEILKNYLQNNDSNNINNTNLWCLEYKILTGRGIYTKCNLPPNSIVFVDYPLLLGPRLTTESKKYCSVCYKVTSDLIMCNRRCGLPLCSNQCIETNQHRNDCNIICQRIKSHFNEWSPDLLRTLTALRGLQLSKHLLDLLLLLQAHSSKQSGIQLQLLKNINLQFNDKNEEDLFTHIGYILATNAFETIVTNNETVSLQGLYPVSSIMNHSCSPNTTHFFNSQQRMIVKTTRFINAGEEITTTYTNLFWGTLTRRHNLFETKQFWCQCERCQSPNEFGFPLNALYCANCACSGYLLPSIDSRINAVWKCVKCNLMLPCKQIGLIQIKLATYLRIFNDNNIANLIKHANQLIQIVPECNESIINLKIAIVKILGSTSGYFYNELSEANLLYKEQLCRDLLKMITILRLENCRFQEFIYQHLYYTLNEKISRKQNLSEDVLKQIMDEIKNLEKEIKNNYDDII